MCDPWLPLLVGLLGGLAVTAVTVARDRRELADLRRRGDEYAKLRALAEHIAENPDPYAEWPMYRLASEVAAMPREGLR